MNNTPTTEERVWAVLAHLSAIAFGMGMLLPIIGWSEQRRKSKYASFQCLQALGYQSLGYTVWVLFSAAIAIIFIIIMLPALNAARGPSAVGIWMGVYAVLIFGLFGSYFLLPVIAAILCALGMDFRYPLIGDRLARYLGFDFDSSQSSDESIWLVEAHEDRWVSAMGHFSVIVPIWGILAPLATWVLQGKRNLFLKFQVIQTIVYQAGVTILYFGAIFLYLFGILIISLMAVLGWKGNVGIDSSMGIVNIVFLGGSILTATVILLIVPLFHIMGQWAGYRVLKGDNYHYPLLGNLVEKQISKLGSEENLQ